jgi:hypothetical protein
LRILDSLIWLAAGDADLTGPDAVRPQKQDEVVFESLSLRGAQSFECWSRLVTPVDELVGAKPREAVDQALTAYDVSAGLAGVSVQLLADRGKVFTEDSSQYLGVQIYEGKYGEIVWTKTSLLFGQVRNYVIGPAAEISLYRGALSLCDRDQLSPDTAKALTDEFPQGAILQRLPVAWPQWCVGGFERSYRFEDGGLVAGVVTHPYAPASSGVATVGVPRAS